MFQTFQKCLLSSIIFFSRNLLTYIVENNDSGCVYLMPRLVLKGNNIEMTADALGLTMESNGIRILEPFDTTLKYSNSSGKTNIHLFVSDIFMNFTFSILKLFLAVEDDILSFLRMTSKKETIICSHFDKVGTIKSTLTSSYIVFLPGKNIEKCVLRIVNYFFS